MKNERIKEITRKAIEQLSEAKRSMRADLLLEGGFGLILMSKAIWTLGVLSQMPRLQAKTMLLQGLNRGLDILKQIHPLEIRLRPQEP